MSVTQQNIRDLETRIATMAGQAASAEETKATVLGELKELGFEPSPEAETTVAEQLASMINSLEGDVVEASEAVTQSVTELEAQLEPTTTP